MAQSVIDSPLLAVEGQTVTLTTTVQYLAMKPKWHEVSFQCPVGWRLGLSPALVHAVRYVAATGVYTDYVTNVIDGVSTTHMPMDAMAVADYVYLGFTEPVLGAYFAIDGTNKNAVVSTLDVEYCSTAMAVGVSPAFTDVAGDSDGTTSGGATMATSGAYKWTLPTTWKNSRLGSAVAPQFTECYWIRFSPSDVFSATVDVTEIIPIYQNTNYAYMEGGVIYNPPVNVARVGGFTLMAVAGTPTLNVNWYKH